MVVDVRTNTVNCTVLKTERNTLLGLEEEREVVGQQVITVVHCNCIVVVQLGCLQALTPRCSRTCALPWCSKDLACGPEW